MEKQPFIGTGHNPEGPDLPLGFGMQLMQYPSAVSAYGRLSPQQKTALVRYMQSGTTGDEAKNLIATAVDRLATNDTSFF